MNRENAKTAIIIIAGAVLALGTVNYMLDTVQHNLEAEIKAEMERYHQLEARFTELNHQVEGLQRILITIQEIERLANKYNTDTETILLVYQMADKHNTVFHVWVTFIGG